MDPLVLTLTLDAESQQALDDLRRRWFPAARNHLAAHVTLFHALPGARVVQVRAVVREAATGTGAFDVDVAAVRQLGRGFAYDLRAGALNRLHAGLAASFRPWLTRQDAQRFVGHVTVANKLEPDAARRLGTELRAEFSPWTARATGLALWWYRGGPWEHLESIAFAD